MEKIDQKMWRGSRREQQLAARSAMLEKWRKYQQNRANRVSAPQAKEVVVPVQVPETKNLVPEYGKSNLLVYKNGEDSPRVPGQALQRFINVYLESAANASVHVVLAWPCGLHNLPLAHVFATAEHWVQGDKRGLRGSYYPAKNNTFFPLNHIQLSRSSILHWARELLENVGAANPKVVVSLPEKDPVYFKIGNAKHERPCINEVMPHFERLVEGQDWSDYSGKLLEHLLTKVKRLSEKAALKSQLAVLGNPRTAPDAIFALGYRLSKADIKVALRSMKKVGLPRVFVIDVTRAVRIKVEGWRNKIFGFLSVFFKVFSSNRPGLVVVTDDPHISCQLREAILQRSKKALGEEVKVRFNPIACTRHDDGLITEQIPEDLLR
jgi:hypothetical protein